MAHIEGNVTIKAPAEQVFSFLADWRNVAECCEGMVDLRTVGEVRQGPGARYSFKVKVPLSGDRSYTVEVSEYIENRGLTVTAVEGGERVEHWWLVEEPGYPNTTRVIYDLRYTVPVPVIGGLVDSLSERKQWEARIQRALGKIKAKVEGIATA
mgnify:CR=1 FL=1